MENIIFKTRNLAKYYTENRQHWDDFYLSEKRIMSSVMDRFENAFSVLDVGCACGGLAGAHRGPGPLPGDKGPDGQRRPPVPLYALPARLPRPQNQGGKGDGREVRPRRHGGHRRGVRVPGLHRL